MKTINWSKLEKEYSIQKTDFNVFQIIEKRIKEIPDSLALSFQYETGKVRKWTYRELGEEVNKFASLLLNEGTKKQDRIALFLPKCPEIYFGTLAAIKIGAIAMPLFEAFQQDGLNLRLERGGANFLITNKELSKRYKKVKTIKKVFTVDSSKFKEDLEKQNKTIETVKLNKKDPCFMIFTSSTAGTPVAGIMLPHQGAVQWIYTGKTILGLKRETKYFCSAHPAWVTGAIYGVLSPFLIGSSIYSIQGRFDAKKWKDFLIKNRISNAYTAPTVFRLLRGEIHKKDLRFIKRICSVGEALPPSLVEFYKKLGIGIIDTYWQTETGAIVIANLPFKRNSLGKSQRVNINLKNGEMVIKTPWPAMMTGIWKHEKMFKSYFSNHLFLTHDLAKKDKQGYFYFEGRKDDIIKTSGERVSPLEIESVLLKFPGIKESAIVGIPDEERGNILKAYIVLNKNIKPSENLKQRISDFVKKNYAGHAYPKIIEFLDDLPKGNSDKVIRAKLR